MAAAATYEPIQNYTLTSDTTVTFTSIPSTYTDLKLVVNGGITNDYWDFRFRINSDSGTNYSQTTLTGDGSSASSSRTTSATKITAGLGMRNSNLNGLMTVDFMNYANTSTYKTCLIRSNNAGYNGTSAVVGLWRSTSAISSIYIYCGASNDGGANLLTGTTLTLYGIAAA